MNTKIDGSLSTTSATQMLLQVCKLGVTFCPWWITPSKWFWASGEPRTGKRIMKSLHTLNEWTVIDKMIVALQTL